ncbi:hypothetical protein LCGC14_2709680 [marine sediment metagenome]|uniref:Uncharacterized protein n=1 Tax=marine sediment metagenome TaxID=412755 RepID=A0A0F9A0Z4_9ZZZZ
MAHIIRPIATISNDGGWTPIGAPTLWEAVDEVIPADGDFARVIEATGAVQQWSMSLGPGTEHGIHTGHIIRWRFRRHAVAIRLNVRLLERCLPCRSW